MKYKVFSLVEHRKGYKIQRYKESTLREVYDAGQTPPNELPHESSIHLDGHVVDSKKVYEVNPEAGPTSDMRSGSTSYVYIWMG